MTGRKVVVFKCQKAEGFSNYQKVSDGHGVFLGFGVNYEELENGVGQYSTALVERPDGSVINVPVEMIVFNN